MGGREDRSQSGPFVLGLRCTRCGRDYTVDEIDYVCSCRPNMGSDLGTLDVRYDYDAIKHMLDPRSLAADPDRSIGRYWPLLPINRRENLPPLPVGGTPLL